MNNEQELIPHLFRTEYSKIVSVLSKLFGFDQIEIAEDIAGDTFLTATETWGLKGIPPNPTAWLYNVAKNKAKNHLQRAKLFENKIAPEIKINLATNQEIELDLSESNINDSQLQMMFAICNPAISVESQIGLSLRILCGFGIDEIADAFLSNKETINKRLLRAKEKLRTEKVKIELPGMQEINVRLDVVLTTLYLLFSEGYYSTSQNKTLRKDLCLEAIRLCYMLVENNATNKPPVNALLSLMCFHASRFEARTDDNGELVLYNDQDSALWNKDLIEKGEYFLNQAAQGNKISKYHTEAAIAYWHTIKDDSKNKWENILQLYNQLLQIEYSPMAALNRTFALSMANGKNAAIIEAEKLKLTDNHFYYVLLGELYTGIDNNKAKQNFEAALVLAKTDSDKKAISTKINNIV
ncbi:MAG: RNA polymerase subunit sigma [Bacteroidetes bacterium]|nr:RNA polymerase subunit sigma [Bacteroidota bacterium]